MDKILLSRPIAHRGLHDIKCGIPENSLLAFSEAIKCNYVIELDIHISKDGKVLVFHDNDLYRMTGKSGKVADFTYDEIKNLKLANTNQKIPLLEEALKIINGQVPVIVELKNNGCDTKLEKAAGKILRHYRGEYAIKSFNPVSLWYFKKFFPHILRGQLVSNFKGMRINWIKKIVVRRMIFNFLFKPDFVSCDLECLSDRKVQKIRKRKPVLGWVVKTQKDFIASKKLCDNIIFEKIRP